jgi:transcriptional regulator with XRE-family HTH domain
MAVLRLKELMTLKGMSRDELSSRVGVSPTTVSNISSEKNLPTIQLLLKIAEALDVDIRELFVPTMGNVITKSEVDETKALLEKSLQILKGNV